MKGIFLIVFICLMFSAIAQKRMEDVIHLKNGSMLRGRLLPDSLLRIKLQTADGSVWAFDKTEVDFVTAELRFRNFLYKDKGFAHFTELGPLVAGKTTIDGVTTAAFTFQTVNGYKFNQYFFSGLGLGVDLYATQTVIPLFASVRGDFSMRGTIIPFYFLDAGYGFNLTQNSSAGVDFKGGLTYAGGLGVKIPFNRTAGFLLGIGYRLQKTGFVQDGDQRKVEYRRLAIRAGFWL
jgi:hypothetical protein